MRVLASLAVICLLFATSCSPPTSSTFLAGFNPMTTLGKVGGPEGIAYLNGSAGTSSGKDLFSGVSIDKHWTFNFQGSHAQLSKQLDQFRAEVESQLTSSGCSISGRGRWSGNFSGFSFGYSSGGRKGFIRVSGVSLESGSQGLEVLVYEH